jgi:hypothetical protein
MNSPVADTLTAFGGRRLPALSWRGKARVQIALVLCASVLLAAAVTRQSLWIDEAYVVWFASHPSYPAMFRTLWTYQGSEAQMPLYLVYMRAWVQLFGRSEVALRAANLPFAALLLAAMSWTSATLLRRRYAWLLLGWSPMLWFYMNEARPYVALMATSAVVAAAVLAYCFEHERYARVAPWTALAAFTVGFGFHMLAVFLTPAALLFLLLCRKGQLRREAGEWLRPALVFLPLIALIAGYYAWKIAGGAGGMRATAGWKNLAFMAYEFAGFAGLGPPRNDLRAGAGGALSAYWPWLLLGCAAMGALAGLVVVSRRHKFARHFLLSTFVALMLAVLACQGAHFRFLGRHLAALFPFLFISVLMLTNVAPKTRRVRALAVASTLLLAAAWAASDARLVLLPSYAKDDYREAVAIAAQAAGSGYKEVLWAADDRAASYYGLHVVDARAGASAGATSQGVAWPEAQQAISAGNWTAEEAGSYISGRRFPTVLVLSKADLYDRTGAWSSLLAATHGVKIAAPNAFAIYELPLAKLKHVKTARVVRRRPLF